MRLAGHRKVDFCTGSIPAAFIRFTIPVILSSLLHMLFNTADMVVVGKFVGDAAQAVAWANEYMRKELGGERLYIGGSSAGGYLSMMLCFDKRYLERVGLDNSKVAGYFHDAGQPTAHFNVLKYADIDPRRIIVDETAPLYYVGLEKEYPPMRFVVSDNDMKNRYEQTMLMLSTLSHFGYQNFDHIVMHGKHCEYCGKIDNDGESVFGQMIYDFVKRFE